MPKGQKAVALPMPEPSLDYDDYELQAQAQIVADAFCRALNKKHNIRIPIPVPMDFELHTTDPRTAGMAYGNMRIGINMIMFRDHPREFLNIVIPHECAHLAEYKVAARTKEKHGGHGYLWAAMMQSISQPVRQYTGMSADKSVKAYKEAKKAKKAKKET